MITRKYASTLVVLAALVAFAPAQQRSIDDFFLEFSERWVRMNPNLAVFTRYLAGEEQDRLEQQLTSYTDDARKQRLDVARSGLTELRRFDRTRLTDVQRVSAELLEWQLGQILEDAQYEDFWFPFNQSYGDNVGLVNTLTVTHPLRTARDASNYVARLRQVAPRMTEAIAESIDRAEKGLIPPRFIVNATLLQMRRFIEPPPSGNPLVTEFESRAQAIKDLSAEARAALVAEAEKIVAANVYPRWKEAIALLESLAPRSTDDAGLWRFKGGGDAYAYSLRRYTTTTLTADEIHQIGLREVGRISGAMEDILRRLGRTEGPLNARIALLKKDLSYPVTEDGRKQIMADIDAMIRDAERRAAAQFDRRPKGPVIAQPYPRFREANAAASYTAPPLDGSRPGIFQMPLRPERMTKFQLRTLVYHETVPGHHFQLALNAEDASLPRFRQARVFGGISAITEGWALYAERLAAESGWYEGDPEGLLGQLDAELWRARRLVVDTGLHAKKWTRQQAIDYGIEVSEVERYVVNPGQACSYMIGQLKILELRDRAKAALADRFSERQFHNVVLGVGSVPLNLLEREVDRYIGSRDR
jgi:uncharacterized protein (DUF885 family)